MSDLISREDVIATLCFCEETKMMLCKDLRKILEKIIDMPSAEPERENGEWIIRYFDMETYEYKEKVYNYYEKMPEGDVYCSECKESALLNGHEESVFSNFCPHCGADLRL